MLYILSLRTVTSAPVSTMAFACIPCTVNSALIVTAKTRSTIICKSDSLWIISYSGISSFLDSPL